METQVQTRPDRTLSFKRIRELTDLSRTTVWRLQRAGQFPQPIRISPGRVGWLERDILAWQRDRAGGESAVFARLPERPPTPARTQSVVVAAASTPTRPKDDVAAPTATRPRRRAAASTLNQLGFEF